MKTILALGNKATRLWNEHSFKVANKVTLNHELIKEAVTNFYDQHVNQILDNEYIIVLFRIKTSNNVILTIGQMATITKKDKNDYIQIIQDLLYIKSDEYMEEIIHEIIFSFGIRTLKDNETLSAISTVSMNNQDLGNIQYQNYKHYKLPATMEVNNYGTIIHSDNKVTLVQITPLTLAKIKREKDFTNVEIYKNGRKIIVYKDKWIDDSHFERVIGNNKYKFTRKGQLELFTVSKPSRFIKKTKLSSKLDSKIVTLDIETRVVNNKHEPYLVCYYDGNQARSFYLTDYNNPNEMLQSCIKSLLVKKYNKHKIYIHNLANFDGIFLLKNLVTLGELSIIMNKGKLISIDLTIANEANKIEISFRDSYQILLASLSKLAKSFKIDLEKEIFPYRFVDNHPLDYIGELPDIEYFDNITQEDYDDYEGARFNSYQDKEVMVKIAKFVKQDLELEGFESQIPKNLLIDWNLKDEAIAYCENDCIVLHKIMIKFNQLFFNQFHININDHVTLPSLAFRLFRSKYLDKDTIPMIYGDVYNKLKTSYTGGAVDMYIPKNDIISGELVYAYDVNSLYPFVMSAFPMPVGDPIYFEGNIRKHKPEAFGFFYCKITCPDSIQHPILQTHVKSKAGLRTIAAQGTYHDMIFSHSYDVAIKAGYKIDILWGYTFSQGYIFDSYVNDLYKMRLDYPKTDPMNYIAKICLNSLYGKFGMRQDFDEIKILDSKEFDKFLSDKHMLTKDVVKLDDHFLIQKKSIILNEELKDFNINVAIASAITSYARDYMSQFKNNDKLKLFYSDTDSIYTNLSPVEMDKLFPAIVNSKVLGKLKLEGIYKRVIFLAPKCYVLEDEKGKLSYKVKGLISKDVTLTYEDFDSLLNKDSKILKTHTKWYKSLSEGTISILKQSYTLQQTDNKRELVYNNQKLVINTKPYKISESKFLDELTKKYDNDENLLSNNIKFKIADKYINDN